MVQICPCRKIGKKLATAKFCHHGEGSTVVGVRASQRLSPVGLWVRIAPLPISPSQGKGVWK